MSEKQAFWLERFLLLLDDDARAALLKPAYTGEPSDAQLIELGYMRPIKRLADGRICALMPINSGLIALCVGITPWGHPDSYYYRYGEAGRALDAWNGEGEPSGWFRHPQSGRRRADGDPAKEYFQP